MPFSESSSSAGSATSTPAGAIPTTIAVAPGRSTSQASRIVAGRPIASKAWSTPPRSERPDRGQRLAGARGQHAVGRAARTRQRQLRRVALDRDDPPGAGEPGRRDQLQADAAAADHADRLPGRDAAPRCARRRPPSRRRSRAATPARAAGSAGIATAQPAGTTQCWAKQETKLKCCSAVPSASRRRELPSSSVPAQAAAAAASQRLRLPAVQARHSPQAGTKQNATGSPGADVRHAVADRLDDAGALVTEHDRMAPGAEMAVGEVQVGVADPGGGHAHQQLARARRLQLDLEHLQRRAVRVQDGGARPHAIRCASSASRSGVTPSPGPGRRRDRAVGADLDRRPAEQPVASLRAPARRIVRDLDERARRHRQRQVQVGEQPEPVRPRVRGEHPAAQVGEPRDPAAAAETAREHHVGLHDVDAAAQDQVARLGETAHHLARRDPQRRAGAQARVAVDVVRRQRLLEPVDAERLERPGALDRGRRRPSAASGRPPCASRGWRRPSAPRPRRRHRAPPRPPRRPRASPAGGSGSSPPARRRRAAPRRGGALRGRDQLTAGGVCRDPLRAAAEQPPQRLAERARDQVPDRHLDGPGRPPWKSTVSQISRTTSVRRGSRPTSRRSSSATSGRPSPPLA